MQKGNDAQLGSRTVSRRGFIFILNVRRTRGGGVERGTTEREREKAGGRGVLFSRFCGVPISELPWGARAAEANNEGTT